MSKYGSREWLEKANNERICLIRERDEARKVAKKLAAILNKCKETMCVPVTEYTVPWEKEGGEE